jgi:molybdate transport system permease protein
VEAWPLLRLTLLTAAAGTALVALPALAVALWLARRRGGLKPVVEALVLLPLVLPPVATGLVLLQLFGRRGPLGSLLHERLGIDVAFTPAGVSLAMAVMAFPLFVLTARSAFEAVDARLEQVAATLGASRRRVLLTITLPLAWPGLLAALVLAFARAVGEFGATVMLAGAIPGRTATLATGIWQEVQLGHDAVALRLMGLSTAAAGLLARRMPRRP